MNEKYYVYSGDPIGWNPNRMDTMCHAMCHVMGIEKKRIKIIRNLNMMRGLRVHPCQLIGYWPDDLKNELLAHCYRFGSDA